MLQYLLFMLAVFAMAKRRAKRKFNLRRVRIANSAAVGALATLDVLGAALTPNAADKVRVISANLAWSWSDIASIADDSLEFGLAHSSYTDAQIEEALEATGSWDLGDKVAQERGNRLVRSIGVISGEGLVSSNQGAQFNDGKPVKTKLNWLLSAGDAITVWMRNASGTVYSTGSALTTVGDLWVKD